MPRRPDASAYCLPSHARRPAAAVPALMVVLLGWLSLALVWAAQAQAQNLLANGNMEQTGKDKVPGWTAYAWEGSGQIETTEAAAFEGRRSVMIFGDGIAKQAVFQQPELPACSYILSGKAAAFGAIGNASKLSGAIHVIQADGQNTTHRVLTGDTGWRYFQYTFTVRQPGKTSVYLFNYGSGRIFFDDVTLEKVAGCPKLADRFAFSETDRPLTFDPPVTDADWVLGGYCRGSYQSRHALCERLGKAGRRPSAVRSGPPKAPLNLADFETRNPFDFGTRLTSEAISGAKSAIVTAGSYISARSKSGLPSDWSSYDWLRLDVRNPSPGPEPLNVQIWDDKTNGYWERVNWYTFAAPGTSTIEVPLQTHVGEKSVIGDRRRLDLKNVRVLAISETKTDLTVDNFRLEADPPITSGFDELIALDAGPGSGPVMTGFSQFTPAHIYRPERGWGIIPGSAVARSEDRRHPDNLYRDWISFTGGGLQFDLPNGDYTVWLMLEDPGYWEYYPSYRSRNLLIQEQVVHTETPSYQDFLKRYLRHASDEDLPGSDIWKRYVEARYHPQIYQARVTDGRLTIRFKSSGDPYANALSAVVVYPTTRAKNGQAFLRDLAQRRERQFNGEYRQLLPLQPAANFETAETKTGAAALEVFHRPVGVPVQASDRPGPNEVVSRLGIELARGQIEPLTVSLRAQTRMTLVGARLTLKGLGITPRVIRYRAKRQTEDGSIYMSVPRVLDPLEADAETPLVLAPGVARTLWFDVEAPLTAPAGRIDGTLDLRFGDGSTRTLPVVAEVLPWSLPEADIPIGYLGVAPSYPGANYPELAERRIKELDASVKLLRKWGMTAASGGLSNLIVNGYRAGVPLIDFALADTSMAAVRRAFKGDVLTYSGLQLGGALQPYAPIDTRGALNRPFNVVLKDVLGAITRHGKAEGWPELRLVVGDEPRGENVQRSIEMARAIKTAAPEAKTAVFTSFVKGDEETAALAGAVDRLYIAHHNAATVERIVKSGSECSLYNRFSRFERGFYLYKMRQLGCRGHMMFAFSSVHADPWYGLDGREEEYVAVFVHPDGRLRPAVDFALYRVGVTDYRTILALERAIGAAADGPAKVNAKAFLADLERRTQVGHTAPRPWTEAELDSVRLEVNRLIRALGYSEPLPGPAAKGR